MEGQFLENEATIRLVAFCSVLFTIAVWEVARPRRVLNFSKPKRWFNNILLIVTGTVLLRVLFPTAAIGAALAASQHNWGLLNVFSVTGDIPIGITVIISVIVLDCIIYWQHRLFHEVTWLWQLHQIHHADPDYDVSTAVRFHPFEIIISMLIKIVVIVLLGVPVIAVVVFEILLNACALFNHGNVTLPKKLDAVLRRVLVTPDMHRVHHSTQREETNSNYGFCLSVWDCWFRSYNQDAKLGQTAMNIGLDYIQSPKSAISFLSLIVMPFTVKPNNK